MEPSTTSDASNSEPRKGAAGDKDSKPHGLAKEVIFAGGLLAAVFGFGGEIAKDWWFGDEREICAQAHAAVMDDQLNREIPEAKRRAYLEKQVAKAISCSDRGAD